MVRTPSLRRSSLAPLTYPSLGCHSSTDNYPEFSKQLQGYENVLCQCHNCVSPRNWMMSNGDQFRRSPFPGQPRQSNANIFQGNYSARVIKRNPWFTFCFVPVVPLSIHGYEDVVCSICNFAQPLQNRQDVMNQINGGGGGVPLQNNPNGPPAGWGGGPPGQGPKPQQGNMQYA